VNIVVAVVTFQRPALLAELASHLAPQLEAADAELLVVDNDPARSAEGLAGVRYVAEPTPGIPAARNRALDEAGDATLLAFTDDDVRPSVDWLRALLDRQRATDADVVTGPVRFVFPSGAPRWADGAHCFRTRAQSGPPPSWPATNNVLLRLDALRQNGIRFEESYGMAGGSDTELFRRLGAAGATFAWADDAVVDELVPAERATARWAIKRSYRTGNTVTLCDVEERGRGAVAGEAARQSARWARWGMRAAVASVVRRDVAGAMRAASSFARAAGLLSGLTGHRVQEYQRSRG
jgi:glycosyltransferase involved in cell wall biosynthesis